MRLLFDTHLLLWAAAKAARLPKAARALLEDPANERLFSAVSIWEVAIKAGLGRVGFQPKPQALLRGLVENGYVELPVTSGHAAAVERLPLIHKDPFDRILIAQAEVEGVTLVTADPVLAKYPGPVQQV